MSAVFGVLCRGADRLPPSVQDKLQAFINIAKPEEYQIWKSYGIGIGHSLTDRLSVANTISQSLTSMPYNVFFVFAGRLDNTSELLHLLNIPDADRIALSDCDVMRRAYCQWGVECSTRMFGDWAFAAWNQDERKLVLARSHYGSVPLYYHFDRDILAFASSRQTLIDLKLAPLELDELWLAQHLISWPASYGMQTPHKQIKCLPPAHYLVVTPNSCNVKRYWFPEDAAELNLSRREDYVEGFCSVFDEAVRCRLRTDGPIATTLSGGLDSGAVTVTAAKFLKAHGQRLTAFTSVPLYNPHHYESERFGDEFPFAKATADFAENIDLHPLSSSEISPIETIRRVLRLGGVPCHGAGNLYWLMDIQQAAKSTGCSVLLTGAAGNGGVSWTGDLFSQSWLYLLTNNTWQTLARDVGRRTKLRIKSSLPINLLNAWQQRHQESNQLYRNSAINPDFARRMHLLEQRLHDPNEQPANNPREQRARILMLGKSVFGAYSTEIAAANGLDLRDPTADARVLDFVLKVPDRIFMDPKTGIDRWLIREAMKDRLPDRVRLNRNRGLQGSDMVPRLRYCATEVEAALNELSSGPAAEYVDVHYMRHVWQMVQSEDTPAANVASKQILLRGIMTGLFVNNFYS